MKQLTNIKHTNKTKLKHQQSYLYVYFLTKKNFIYNNDCINYVKQEMDMMLKPNDIRNYILEKTTLGRTITKITYM